MSSARSITAPGRAVGRWAWRLFRRDWRSQLLVLALIVATVAIAVVGSSMATESQRDPTAIFGRADAMVHVRGDDVAQLDAVVAAADQRFGEVETIGLGSTAVPGSVDRITVLAQDPHGTLGAPMLDLRAGRFPVGGTEVAMSASAARAFGAELGKTVTIDGAPRTLVGIVANPYSSGMTFALVDPDGAPPAQQVNILVAGANDRAAIDGLTGGLVERRADHADDRLVLVVVVVTTAMILVGLVAAAGFVTIARRRQRQLGLLAAVGGSRRHLQVAMLACGTIVGVAGAVLGTAVAVVVWQLVRGSVGATAQHHIGALQLPWALVAVIALLAVVTSTLAAWWPARTASRIPVMAALSGRPLPPRPVHRPVLAGVALVAAGAGAIAMSGATRPHPKPGLLVAGLPVVVVGLVLIAPALVGVTGRVAGRLPLAPRLAVRDVARHRSRAAASVAAITLALGVTTGIVVVARANASDQGPGNLPADQLLVQVADGVPRAVGTSATSAAAPDRGIASVAAALEPGTTVLDLELVTSSTSSGPPLTAMRQVGGHTFENTGLLYVATPAVLAWYGIDPASIDPATDLLVADRGIEWVDDRATRPGEDPLPTEVRSELPAFSSAPQTLVTEAGLVRHGWQAVTGGWLLDAPTGLTAGQLAAARAAAADAGLAIEARSTGSDDTVIVWATRIGITLAVLIVLMSVALGRADAAGDDRILTANGARPRTRRALAATTAAVLGLLGALLGTAGTYVVALATFHADLSRLWPVPWAPLTAVVAGLPVLAAAIAWLVSGREPAALGRRPLD